MNTTRFLRRIFSFLILLFFITVAALPERAIATSSQSLAEETLICLCGCGQTIKNCPHENCGFAIPARKTIASLVKEGKSFEEIIDYFVEKYGGEVLAAPKKEGFNLIGYVMPFVILALAGAFIMVIVRVWTARGIKDEEKILPSAKKDLNSDLGDRIEKELEELD